MTAAEQLRLWKEMLRIRLVEEAIAARYSEQEMRCPVHLSIGQEAVAVGVCRNLRDGDIVFSNHRSHAHYLAKGGSLRGLIAELYGKSGGCSGGRGGSMHLIDRHAGFWGATPIVAGTVPIAAGVALAAKRRHSDHVVVVFCGDGCVEEGVVHETMNVASLHAIPLVFICENNGYSVYTDLKSRQPHRPLCDIAGAHAIPAMSGDGNDVEIVHQVSAGAVARARAGQGPQFLELWTYRWLEHCGPNDDDGLGYRPAGELMGWKLMCPIRRLSERLLERKIAFDEVSTRTEIELEIQSAFEFARESEQPRYADLKEYV